jgi:hypothetical protein
MILDARTLDYSALIFRVIILMLGIALGGILVIKGKRKMGILQIIASISVPLLTSICCVYMKNVTFDFFYISDFELVTSMAVNNMVELLPESIILLYIAFISITTLSIEALVKSYLTRSKKLDKKAK